MNHVLHVGQAVLNGITYLKEEQRQGKGSVSSLAAQNFATALMRNNERAALYWHEVMMTSRKLEQRTARTKLLIAA
jgi:hypothetical protein